MTSDAAFAHEAALDGATEAAVAGGAARRRIGGVQVEAGGFKGKFGVALRDAREHVVFDGLNILDDVPAVVEG